MRPYRKRPWLTKPSKPRARLFMADVSPDLIARMQNWGRFVRLGEAPPELSPTARALESLARSRGQLDAARQFRPDVDEREAADLDAMIVDRAICNPRMPLLPKRILRLHYVRRVPPQRWDHKALGLTIVRSEKETVLVRSHHIIANVLARMEATRYKATDNSTPAADPDRVIIPGASSPRESRKASHSAGLCRFQSCECPCHA